MAYRLRLSRLTVFQFHRGTSFIRAAGIVERTNFRPLLCRANQRSG